MILKGHTIPELNLRKGYDVSSQEQISHFAVRVTTPQNPFRPEKHGERRFWFILEGGATVTIDGESTLVEPGDLVLVAPWTEHSLQTDGSVRWICFG
jgi:mannose-6-phosphate isomerase-like protein (cupin superfamily)